MLMVMVVWVMMVFVAGAWRPLGHRRRARLSIALLGTRLTIVYIIACRCRSLMLILLPSGCISSLVSHTIELAALIKRA